MEELEGRDGMLRVCDSSIPFELWKKVDGIWKQTKSSNPEYKNVSFIPCDAADGEGGGGSGGGRDAIPEYAPSPPPVNCRVEE